MTSTFSIDQAGAVIGGFLLLTLLFQILKHVRVFRRLRNEDKAGGRVNQHAIPEDPHYCHIERDQIEDLHNEVLALPDDPLMPHSTAQSHALTHDQHQLVNLDDVPLHMINNNNVLTFEKILHV